MSQSLDCWTPGLPTIKLAGSSVYKADWTVYSGKSRGGGVCIYINNSWLSDTKVIDTHCLPAVEYLLWSCRPFLPTEGVYISYHNSCLCAPRKVILD